MIPIFRLSLHKTKPYRDNFRHKVEVDGIAVRPAHRNDKP